MSAKIKEDWTPQDYIGSLKWATSSLTFPKVNSTKKQYKTITQPNVLEPNKNKAHLVEKTLFQLTQLFKKPYQEESYNHNYKE